MRSDGPSPAPAGRPIPAGLDAALVLVRHGESEMIVEGRFQGRAETPLSPLGRDQAALAGARLGRVAGAPALPVPAGAPIEIAHSPLRRTTETAEAVARALAGTGESVALRPEPGLVEIGQGDWEGRLHTEVAERWADRLAAWRARPEEASAPGGESLAAVRERVEPAIDGIVGRLAAAAAAHPPAIDGDSVVARRPWSIVVGHDGVFKVALLSLFGIDVDRFWMWRLDLAGISVVELAGGRAVLRAHNLTEHLAPLREAELAAEARAEARRRSGAL